MPYHRTCPQDVPKMDDAGAGEIWMITRSVLVRDAEGVVLIITTDLPVVSRTGFGQYAYARTRRCAHRRRGP